jgi:hypothetical protein
MVPDTECVHFGPCPSECPPREHQWSLLSLRHSIWIESGGCRRRSGSRLHWYRSCKPIDIKSASEQRDLTDGIRLLSVAGATAQRVRSWTLVIEEAWRMRDLFYIWVSPLALRRLM